MGGHSKGLVEPEESHMASSRKQGRHVAGVLQEGLSVEANVIKTDTQSVEILWKGNKEC